jgi:hypothetical protein
MQRAVNKWAFSSANINKGNDLANLIKSQDVGKVCQTNKLDESIQAAVELKKQLSVDEDLKKGVVNYLRRNFQWTWQQIKSSRHCFVSAYLDILSHYK